MSTIRILSVAIAALVATACTKPQPTEPAANSVSSPADRATAPSPAAKPAVFLYNAYLSNGLTAEGVAGEPGKQFRVGDKIYAGAVVHGNAPAASIKVEWTADPGVAPSSGETSIPVVGASVATVDLTSARPLAAGNYKALVYLDGAPGWELEFTVTP